MRFTFGLILAFAVSINVMAETTKTYLPLRCTGSSHVVYSVPLVAASFPNTVRETWKQEKYTSNMSYLSARIVGNYGDNFIEKITKNCGFFWWGEPCYSDLGIEEDSFTMSPISLKNINTGEVTSFTNTASQVKAVCYGKRVSGSEYTECIGGLSMTNPDRAGGHFKVLFTTWGSDSPLMARGMHLEIIRVWQPSPTTARASVRSYYCSL